jgi:hypothetical protein
VVRKTSKFPSASPGSLVVRPAAEQEVDVHRTVRLSPLPVDAAFPLLELGGIPFEVVVYDVAAILLQVNAFLADRTGNQDKWRRRPVLNPGCRSAIRWRDPFRG